MGKSCSEENVKKREAAHQQYGRKGKAEKDKREREGWCREVRVCVCERGCVCRAWMDLVGSSVSLSDESLAVLPGVVLAPDALDALACHLVPPVEQYRLRGGEAGRERQRR